MAFQRYISVRLDKGAEITSKHINAVQDRISGALSQLLGKDVLDRSLVKGVALVPTGVNYVGHKLGRAVQGYNVVKRQPWDLKVGDASGVASGMVAFQLDRYLPLVASATGTVALEVF
jgi:hypothetical protein